MAYPDRQIVGHTKESYNIAGDVMQLLPLAPFERILPATEAEMIKYFGNTWFSTKVTFANQMYDLCQAMSINYDRMMEAAAADKRIGRSHLQVLHKGYRGYGGKCLPKDHKALIQLANSKGIDLKLHKAVDKINEELMHLQNIDDPEKFSVRE
jgi:UDP-glucose 6-dehydrogenase